MMYANLNTFIQFLAAIFVTIALDDVLFNRFWTPDILKTTLAILKRYDLDKPQIIEDKFKLELGDRFGSLETISRRRGFFNVCLCLFLLVYNVLLQLDSYATQYPFIMYLVSIIGSYTIMLFSRYLLSKRLRLSLTLILYLSLLITLINTVNSVNLTSPVYNQWGDSNKIMIIVTLLILPILYQLFLTILYSEGYTQYLSHRVAQEAILYEKAKKALVKHEDNLIPEEYRHCFATTKHRTEDTQFTKIDEHLCKRLKGICCNFSLWMIIKNFKFRTTNDIDKTIRPKLSDEDETIEDSIVELSYVKLVEEYKRLKPTPKMPKFCSDKNIDYNRFRKVYNDSLRKTSE